jgi:hypothetical protein
MTEHPGGLTRPGQRGLQDCSAGGVAHYRSCPVKFIVDDHGLRAVVMWAPGQDRVGQCPGIPHVV